MKLVIDTNVLFSFFWKNSLTKSLITTSDLELISPEIALEEIEKYSEDIKHKLKINKREFHLKLDKLKETIKFIKKSEYSPFINEARVISPDKDDIEFFALCLKFSCPLWSNDSLLKKQDKIDIFSTSDIADMIFG
jgi:predicted nucleic acid-binding protein